MNEIISDIKTVFQKYVKTLFFSIVALAHMGSDGIMGHEPIHDCSTQNCLTNLVISLKMIFVGKILD